MEIQKREYTGYKFRTGTSSTIKRKIDDKEALHSNRYNAIHRKHPALTENIVSIQNSFNCSLNEATNIKNYWSQPIHNSSCQHCSGKWESCHDCVNVCTQEASRMMLLTLQKYGIKPQCKQRITKDGFNYAAPTAIDFDQILAIPDFYIQLGIKKICLFIDFNAANKSTQAKLIRNKLIDNQLSKLGYCVIRPNATEILHNCSSVIEDITEKVFQKVSKTSPRLQRLKTILG